MILLNLPRHPAKVPQNLLRQTHAFRHRHVLHHRQLMVWAKPDAARKINMQEIVLVFMGIRFDGMIISCAIIRIRYAELR